MFYPVSERHQVEELENATLILWHVSAGHVVDVGLVFDPRVVFRYCGDDEAVQNTI